MISMHFLSKHYEQLHYPMDYLDHHIPLCNQDKIGSHEPQSFQVYEGNPMEVLNFLIHII